MLLVSESRLRKRVLKWDFIGFLTQAIQLDDFDTAEKEQWCTGMIVETFERG
jgi:hypothetical protein